MANEFSNRIRIKGSNEDLERIEAAIEAAAIDCGQGYRSYKEFYLDEDTWKASFPDWEASAYLGNMESRYQEFGAVSTGKRHQSFERDDGRAVRMVEGVLVIETHTRSHPPTEFVARLQHFFPTIEIHVISMDLSSGILDIWNLRAGRIELVEHQGSAWIGEEIYEWKKGDKVWNWTGEKTHDIAMMADFLRDDLQEATIAVTTDESLAACRIAYDTLAIPAPILPEGANGYAFHLAFQVAEYRNSIARTPFIQAQLRAAVAQTETRERLINGGETRTVFILANTYKG